MTDAATVARYAIGVAGGGSMGAGIAEIAVVHGHETTVLETSAEAAAAAAARVRRGLDGAVARGRMTPEQARAAAARLHTAHEPRALAAADVVIEAVIEDEAAKKTLLRDVERVCGDDALIASNTSSLSLASLATALSRRGRFAGMHFFNPAPRMKLVEVISAPDTARDAAAALVALARHWRKTPVRAADAPGFIVNRLARPFYGEALRMLEGGLADAAQIDAALRAAGFRMGAFELMDLIGNDVNYAVTESVWQRLGNDARFAPSALQRQKCADGLLGKKSGAGFYRYDGEGGGGRVAPAGEPAGEPPAEVVLRGEHAGLAHLAAAASEGGVGVRRDSGAAGLCVGGYWLAPVETIGDNAGAAGGGIIDYIADYAAAELFAVYCPNASAEQLDALRGFFAAAGKTLLLLPTCPALIALRTIAMMANIAADAAAQGLASREDMDTAMCCGLNHPHGPFAWVEVIGRAPLLQALRGLAADEDAARYAPSAAFIAGDAGDDGAAA